MKGNEEILNDTNLILITQVDHNFEPVTVLDLKMVSH